MKYFTLLLFCRVEVFTLLIKTYGFCHGMADFPVRKCRDSVGLSRVRISPLIRLLHMLLEGSSNSNRILRRIIIYIWTPLCHQRWSLVPSGQTRVLDRQLQVYLWQMHNYLQVKYFQVFITKIILVFGCDIQRDSVNFKKLSWSGLPDFRFVAQRRNANTTLNSANILYCLLLQLSLLLKHRTDNDTYSMLRNLKDNGYEYIQMLYAFLLVCQGN